MSKQLPLMFPLYLQRITELLWRHRVAAEFRRRSRSFLNQSMRLFLFRRPWEASFLPAKKVPPRWLPQKGPQHRTAFHDKLFLAVRSGPALNFSNLKGRQSSGLVMQIMGFQLNHLRLHFRYHSSSFSVPLVYSFSCNPSLKFLFHFPWSSSGSLLMPVSLYFLFASSAKSCQETADRVWDRVLNGARFMKVIPTQTVEKRIKHLWIALICKSTPVMVWSWYGSCSTRREEKSWKASKF